MGTPNAQGTKKAWADFTDDSDCDNNPNALLAEDLPVRENRTPHKPSPQVTFQNSEVLASGVAGRKADLHHRKSWKECRVAARRCHDEVIELPPAPPPPACEDEREGVWDLRQLPSRPPRPPPPPEQSMQQLDGQEWLALGATEQSSVLSAPAGDALQSTGQNRRVLRIFEEPTSVAPVELASDTLHGTGRKICRSRLELTKKGIASYYSPIGRAGYVSQVPHQEWCSRSASGSMERGSHFGQDTYSGYIENRSTMPFQRQKQEHGANSVAARSIAAAGPPGGIPFRALPRALQQKTLQKLGFGVP